MCSYLAPENEPITASWQQQREINPSCDEAVVETDETYRLELRGFFMKSRPCATRSLVRTRFALMCINRLVQLRQNKINQKDPPNSIGPEKSDLNTSNHEPHETPRTLRANPVCVMLFPPSSSTLSKLVEFSITRGRCPLPASHSRAGFIANIPPSWSWPQSLGT